MSYRRYEVTRAERVSSQPFGGTHEVEVTAPVAVAKAVAEARALRTVAVTLHEPHPSDPRRAACGALLGVVAPPGIESTCWSALCRRPRVRRRLRRRRDASGGGGTESP